MGEEDGQETKERTVVDARGVVILVVPSEAAEDEADVNPGDGPGSQEEEREKISDASNERAKTRLDSHSRDVRFDVCEEREGQSRARRG